MQILLVEDTVETAEMLHFFFTRRGHTTIVASEGMEALDILRGQTTRFDVIVLDYQMPNMDGLEFLRQLHAWDSGHSIPLILLTGYEASMLPGEVKEYGVARILQKPILPSALLEAVTEVVQSAR